MDWDWEDGPPRDAPQRRPEEASPHPASEAPSFADAVDRFERPAQAPRDTGPRDDDFSSFGVASDGDPRPRPPADRAAARARRRKQVKRRRLIALVVLAVIVVLIVVLVVRGCGGPSEGQAAGVDSSPRTAVLRTPTAADPLRVAACGESVGGGLKTAMAAIAAVAEDWRLPPFEAAQ